MKLFSTFFVLSLFWLSSQDTFAQTNNVWSLEECVTYAIKNNIQIKQTALEKDLANINQKEAFYNFLPTVNANAVHSWNIGLNQNITTGILENLTAQFTGVGLNVGVDIYNGLQKQNNYQRARLQKIAADYQLGQMSDDVSLNIANAYLQILFNREQLKVQKSQLTTNENEATRAKTLWESGQTPKGDYLDRVAAVSDSEQLVLAAENALLLSKLNLAQLLQLDNYKTFDIVQEDYQVTDNSILFKTPEEIIEQAKTHRSEVKLAETNIQIAEKNLKIARGALQPRLIGFYSFDTRAAYFDRVVGIEQDPINPNTPIGFVEGTNQLVVQPNFRPVFGNPASVWSQFERNKGQNFGVQLSIPIFNGLSARSQVSRSKVAIQRSQLQAEETTLTLERNIYTAYADAQASLKQYQAAQRTLEARKEAYYYASERFNVGLLNTYDLTQAQNLLVVAEAESLRTKYDYLFRTKILQLYFGLPIYQKS